MSTRKKQETIIIRQDVLCSKLLTFLFSMPARKKAAKKGRRSARKKANRSSSDATTPAVTTPDVTTPTETTPPVTKAPGKLYSKLINNNSTY